MVENKISFTTFFVGDKHFGLKTDEVLEIDKDLELTQVPCSAEFISGIINFRGSIVTAIDLSKKLKMKIDIGADEKLDKNIIIGTRSDCISLQVHRIGDIVEVSNENIEKPPESIKGINLDYVKNVCKLPDGLLVILDSKKIQYN